MKISNRLRVISDFVPDNSFILDIGCDHALLDIYCSLHKENVKCIASDINPKPLEFAEYNVMKYDVGDKVEVVLGDGLDAFKFGVDTIVLSGLGASTIVDILSRKKSIIDIVKRIIVSSNNDYYYLRKSICDLGFTISDEALVYENDKYYPIICFEHGKSNYNYYELLYGPVLLEKKEPLFLEYLSFLRTKLVRVCPHVTDKVKKEELSKEISFIDDFLSKN